MSVRLPLERATPASVAELCELLARCDREGIRVGVEGGNTLHGMGIPTPVDLTVVTTALDAIVEHVPADLTIAAQSGIRLRSLAIALGDVGQFVPIDAPHPQEATLGGTLAAGWLGPRRHLYGRPRDYVIGSTIALADGTLAKAGGMVVKNVAGYDTSRMYVGSFGTLGILTRVNLKTIAQPERTRVFLARVPEGARARALERLPALAIPPAAALWIEGFRTAIDGDDGDEGRLLIALEGSAALLERATRDLRSALGKAGVPETRVIDAGAREALARAIDAYIASVGERSLTYRFHQPPDQALPHALAARDLAHRFEFKADLILDAMNGDVLLRAVDLDARALGAKIEIFDDALHDALPQAIVVASEHPMRGALRVWGEPPATIERMRALKARFDPRGTLNSGRFVGGI